MFLNVYPDDEGNTFYLGRTVDCDYYILVYGTNSRIFDAGHYRYQAFGNGHKSGDWQDVIPNGYEIGFQELLTKIGEMK